MRNLMGSVAIAALAAGPVIAADPFNGIWKSDVKSAKFPEKPQVLLLKDGTFTCVSCAPQYAVPADNAFHPVSGQAYTDEAKIEVVDATTAIETDKLKGKVMSFSKMHASADGRTLTTEWSDFSAPNGKAMAGTGRLSRVSPVPEGAHAISGGWKQLALDQVSDSAITETFHLENEVLTLTTPGGYGYKAKLGGPKVPLTGDPAGTMVSVRRISAATLVENDSRDGKLISTYFMTVAASGKVMKVVVQDARQGTSTTFFMHKQ